MGNRKKAWTSEEEAALLAGVAKHGAGKWKIILTDGEFAPHLVNRSNIDFKDKWRNLSYNMSNSAWASQSTPDKETGPWYHEDMIFEAISFAENPDGVDIDAIHFYVQQKSDRELPETFRSYVKTKMGRLVTYGKLERNGNLYKIKEGRRVLDEKKDDEQTEVNIYGTETPEDAALYAAYRIAIAENSKQKAIEACKEVERVSKLVEESQAMLKLAEQLYALCPEDGALFLSSGSDLEHDITSTASNNIP